MGAHEAVHRRSGRGRRVAIGLAILVGLAGSALFAILAGSLRPTARGPRSGSRSISRQVLHLVRGDRVIEIHDASTGSGRLYSLGGATRVARTPTGSFRILRKIDALHESPLGLMYRPAYFVGGYAIHGSSSVPPYPASHGCVRVTNRTMDVLFDRLAIGTPVEVY